MSSPATQVQAPAPGSEPTGGDATAAAPAAPSGHRLVREGPITMLYPQDENSVFYNPVQVQNRDLSVLMLGLYAERRTARRWAARKRKEARKELLQEQAAAASARGEGEGGGGEERKGETKEQRKAQRAAFEREVDSRVRVAQSAADFAQLTIDAAAAEGLSVFEALAASGLRSLRYWKEVPGVRNIVVNDLDPVAVELARENVARNGLSADLVEADRATGTEEGEEGRGANDADGADVGKRPRRRPRGLQLRVGDAAHEMYVSRLPPDLYPSQMNPDQLHSQKPQYDVVDLDPYGSAAPFLDAAVRAMAHGGLLAVTCTDMAALGGSHPETCYGRYGGFPLQRAGFLQELALRLLLYHMSVVAGRYGRTIRPVLSVGMAFYCRVFVEVYDDKAGVNNLSLNHGHLFQSTKCPSFHITPVATNEWVAAQQTDGASTNSGEDGKDRGKKKNKPSNVYRNGRGPCEPVCGETGAPYKIGGPLWTGPLHDTGVLHEAIARLEAAMDHGGVHPGVGVPVHPLHTASTLHGLLVAASEEVAHAPLYYLLPQLCSAVNSPVIPMATFRAALVNAGYAVSAYHKEPEAVKTDAPNHVVWDVVRAWCREHPPAKRKESRKHRSGEEPGSNAPSYQPEMDVATKILSKEMQTTVDFDLPKGVGKRKKAKRWALNPETNWGPKKAASGRNKRKSRAEDDEAKNMEDCGESNVKQVKT